MEKNTNLKFNKIDFSKYQKEIDEINAEFKLLSTDRRFKRQLKKIKKEQQKAIPLSYNKRIPISKFTEVSKKEKKFSFNMLKSFPSFTINDGKTSYLG